jgi:hypothetical protein
MLDERIGDLARTEKYPRRNGRLPAWMSVRDREGRMEIPVKAASQPALQGWVRMKVIAFVELGWYQSRRSEVLSLELAFPAG